MHVSDIPDEWYDERGNIILPPNTALSCTGVTLPLSGTLVLSSGCILENVTITWEDD
jgi:hypothetical protein